MWPLKMSNVSIGEILSVTPRDGFNVVASDRHAQPGARLTLVDYHPTRDAAEECVTLLRLSLPMGEFEIYAPANPR
jgi:hypothetical protein